MEQVEEKSHPIELSFAMESSVSLWNIVFSGFDQEVVLVSRFLGKGSRTTRTLYRFAGIIEKNYEGCDVQKTETGIVIRKEFPRNDVALIRQWTDIMYQVREQMLEFLLQSL